MASLPFIDTLAVKNRLESVLVTPGVKVYRVGDLDFKTSFGMVFPAVYILRQNFSAPSPGGSSQVPRQTYDMYLEIGAVSQRYEPGNLEGENARRALNNDIYDALFGYTPPGADFAFDLSSYTDGDPADTVNYGIQRYHTRALIQKASTP